MKTKSVLMIAALLGVFLVMLSFTPVANAQDVQPPAVEQSPALLDIVSAGIVALAAKYPLLVTIFSVIGLARAIFKPVMAVVETRVKESESTSDDELLAKVESSRWWKVFTFILDWGASVKVGPQLKK